MALGPFAPRYKCISLLLSAMGGGVVSGGEGRGVRGKRRADGKAEREEKGEKVEKALREGESKKPPRFLVFGEVRTPPDTLVLGCKFRK